MINLLVSFAGSSNDVISRHFCAHQDAMCRSAEPYFDGVIRWSFEAMRATEFYAAHQPILDRFRGCGFWLWKPYIILEALRKHPGAVITYWDCGRVLPTTFTARVDPLVNWCLAHDGMLPGIEIDWVQSMNTKRDCFAFMGCDSRHYWDANQTLAGWSVWHGKRAVEFVAEWLSWCEDERCLVDGTNVCGLPEMPGYRGHRHDQSILTNLCVKHDVARFPRIAGRPKEPDAVLQAHEDAAATHERRRAPVVERVRS